MIPLNYYNKKTCITTLLLTTYYYIIHVHHHHRRIDIYNNNKSIYSVLTLAPIWLPHCPAWMCTISLILAG